MKSKNKKKSLGPARLSAVPAAMIDRAYLKEHSSFLGKAYHFIKVRSVYSFLFLPAAGLDLITAGVMASRYAAGSFFNSDERQDRELAQQKIYSSLFSKNLLALVFSPLGFYSPKLVGFTFIPKQTESGVISGSRYYHLPEAECIYPKDEEELISIIKEAALLGKKIMAVGAGRSQGKQFLPEGDQGKGAIVIDLSHFNAIAINTENKTATVGAGVLWGNLQLEADKNKLANKVQQASPEFSIGGSTGTNIHGWDHHASFLSNTILSINVVTAQGEYKTLTPKDELFNCVLSGFGLFGIVTSVTLQLTDNELLKEQSVKVELKDYVRHFRENVQTDENIRMHLCRLSLQTDNLLSYGIAVDYVKAPHSKPCTTPGFTKEGVEGTRFNRLMVNFARHFPWIRNKYWRDEERRLLQNNSELMTRNEIMQPPINAMFNQSLSEAEWLQEYFLPEENLEKFIKALGKLLMDNQVSLINASIRFVKKNDQTLLSPAYGGDRFAVVLCFNQSLQAQEIVKASKWLRDSQELTVAFGGSYYLPYQHVSSLEHFHKAYPQAKLIPALKQKYDPEALFSSGFYQKYIVPAANVENYFHTIMATPESKKRFSGFLENVLQRVPSEKLYDLLTDVMKYCDSHAEIYEELCRRLPTIMPSVPGTLKRILHSLSTIKEDLAAQAKILLPDVKTIDGLVEIGYPGRFIGGFKKHFKVSGKVVAVYEAPSITDYIQTGYPRPYDQFVKLDYANPSLHDLPDESAEVITCYVGLHHFTEDKLDGFLKDIRRVLKPNGHFILVDHDVVDHEALSMAYGAHMIFNAVNGVSLEDELQEVRNFQPMAYWKQLLQQYDLGYSVSGPDVPMIRTGDPSRNRMVTFVKKGPENVLVQQAENTGPMTEKVKQALNSEWKKVKVGNVLQVSETMFHNQMHGVRNDVPDITPNVRQKK